MQYMHDDDDDDDDAISAISDRALADRDRWGNRFAALPTARRGASRIKSCRSMTTLEQLTDAQCRRTST